MGKKGILHTIFLLNTPKLAPDSNIDGSIKPLIPTESRAINLCQSALWINK